MNDGILWAAGVDIPATAGQARVPRNLNPAHVINLSIEAAGACAPEQFGVLRDAIDQATRAGSVVVSAAGNKTRDAANVTPASCPGSITVAASDTRGFHASRYSNFGVRVDVLAPGGDVARDDDMDGREDGIWSAVKPGPGNETGIASKNGTSMAAPHVSGVIALGMARMPELQRKPALVLQRLKASLRPIPSGACPQPCGIGMLDAEKFVAP